MHATIRSAGSTGRLLLVFSWAAAIVAGAAQSASAQNIQPGSISVQLDLVATAGSSQNAPNFGAHSGDPRFLYIGQKTGAIRILDFDQTNPLLGTEFLNVNTVLGSAFFAPSSVNSEYGLLGGAFHPDFNNVGTPGYRKFYTYTSEDPNAASPIDFSHPEFTGPEPDLLGSHQSVIREWTAGAPDPQGVITINTGIPSRVLMRITEPQGNHNGGGLAFGQDDYLYISLGDGGGSNDNSGGTNNNTDGHTNTGNPDVTGGFEGHGNAQDRTNVYGSILRIKPTTDADAFTTASANGQYRVPDNNPFTSDAGLVDEIFANGLRNPFRISFDSDTGKLYAGDVGQGTTEEVNVINSGGNYGWVIKEGNDFNGAFDYEDDVPAGVTLIDPLGQYPNGSGGGSAVIGGYVYRGNSIGDLEGKYVFGDLNRSGVSGGGMMYMDIQEPGLNQVFDLDIVGSLSKPGSNIHGLAEDANGELYYLFSNGQIIKLLPEFPLGDYTKDGDVNEDDYDLWREMFGMTGEDLAADGNGDGIVDAADYTVWRDGAEALGSGSGQTATVPEPTAIALAAQLLTLMLLGTRARNTDGIGTWVWGV